jgi:hypothetical protein
MIFSIAHIPKVGVSPETFLLLLHMHPTHIRTKVLWTAAYTSFGLLAALKYMYYPYIPASTKNRCTILTIIRVVPKLAYNYTRHCTTTTTLTTKHGSQCREIPCAAVAPKQPQAFWYDQVGFLPRA